MGVSRHLVDITPLRRFPQYRRLWNGYAVRQLGAQLTVTTVIFQVFKITNSNLAVGYISLAQLFPAILAPMVGGAIADAVDRRKLLVITAVLMALCAVGLALNSMGGHPMLWPLYVLSAASWGLNGIDGPTRTAVQMTLVDRESFVAANVLRQLLQQISLVVGPSLAGLLIAVFSPHLDWVYWIDVISTLGALQAVLRLDPLPPQGGGRKFSLSSIKEGFAFLKGRRIIQACFLADMNATILGLPVSLFPFMAFHHFHGGAKTDGLLMAAPGIGALLGSVLSGWTSRVVHQGRAVLVAIGVWGVALTGFGVVPWLAGGVVLVAIAGWADVISATFRNTIIQVETPDQLRGRLTSISSSVVQGGPRLGNMEAGLVAAVSSAPISIVSGGLGCLAGVFLLAKFIPQFSKYSLESAMQEEKGI
ncbi:MAG TPA: MFS transporter [Acidimicrobiales bacterium]|nr:MFS transporter [Acidimicrobiales bacterium]